MDAITQLPSGIDISSGDIELSLMDIARKGNRLYFTGIDFNTDKSIAFITQDPSFSKLGNKELKEWVRDPANINTVKDQVVSAMGENPDPSIAIVELKGDWGVNDAVIAEVDPQAKITTAAENEPLQIDDPDSLLTTNVELGALDR